MKYNLPCSKLQHVSPKLVHNNYKISAFSLHQFLYRSQIIFMCNSVFIRTYAPVRNPITCKNSAFSPYTYKLFQYPFFSISISSVSIPKSLPSPVCTPFTMNILISASWLFAEGNGVFEVVGSDVNKDWVSNETAK